VVKRLASPPPDGELFDQNIPSALVDRFSDLFPESIHAKNLGIMKAEAVAISTYAA